MTFYTEHMGNTFPHLEHVRVKHWSLKRQQRVAESFEAEKALRWLNGLQLTPDGQGGLSHGVARLDEDAATFEAPLCLARSSAGLSPLATRPKSSLACLRAWSGVTVPSRPFSAPTLLPFDSFLEQRDHSCCRLKVILEIRPPPVSYTPARASPENQ